MFDGASYAMGHIKGVAQGLEEGRSEVTIENGISCTDDGNGNITITEVNNNG